MHIWASLCVLGCPGVLRLTGVPKIYASEKANELLSSIMYKLPTWHVRTATIRLISVCTSANIVGTSFCLSMIGNLMRPLSRAEFILILEII